MHELWMSWTVKWTLIHFYQAKSNLNKKYKIYTHTYAWKEEWNKYTVYQVLK